jgi:large subunit ribosomal protein L18
MRKKMKDQNRYKRWRRHKRVRNRIIGTSERPRVCVFRSNDHIYAQLIDDTAGRTLVSVSSLKIEAPAQAARPASGKKGKADKSEKAEAKAGRKTLLAREVGRLLAEAAIAKGVKAVAFDRGGYLYHGRVAALADAARQSGLEF